MRFLCHFGRMPPGRLTEPIFYFGQVGRGVGKPEEEGSYCVFFPNWNCIQSEEMSGRCENV
jgi:hypothetical protein